MNGEAATVAEAIVTLGENADRQPIQPAILFNRIGL
jgi:hypothetical protein